MQVRHRYFRSRNQEVVFVLHAEEIVLELRKLTGPSHRRTIHHEGRQHLSISVLGGVQIEHVVDQRSFQPGPGSGHDGKPGSGNLRGSIEIQDAEMLSDFPMGFGGARKRRDGAPSTDFDILRGISPHRDRGMGKIGDAKRNVSERLLDFSEGSLGVLDAIPQLLHRGHGRFSRFFGSSQPGHLFRALIEFDTGTARPASSRLAVPRSIVGDQPTGRCSHVVRERCGCRRGFRGVASDRTQVVPQKAVGI